MFHKIQNQLLKQAKEVFEPGYAFQSDVDKDKLWDIYLNAFDPEKRQENDCRCCRHFIRNYASIVRSKNNKLVTLWDWEPEVEEYKKPIKAIREYILSRPIAGVFYTSDTKCGTEKSVDRKRDNLIWKHFFLTPPASIIKRGDTIGTLIGTANANKSVFQRSLNEITDDAVDTVLELIGQNSLYRGQEFKGMLESFKKVKVQYKGLKNKKEKDNFCWAESVNVNAAVTRIRNSAIGTLLNNLSEGMDLDKAVSAFEKVVAPTNYKRPTSLVTPKMIEAAKKRLEELGLVGALNRRLLSVDDLNVNNALWVYRPQKKSVDIFDELKKDVTVNPKSLTKVEEVSINDFIDKILPTAKSISALVENSHLGNFVSLVGPQEPDSGNLLKWGNDYSWSYSGAVADSMRAKVVELGGRVDGVLRFTHSWNHPEVGRNASLMDLHIFLPGSSKHDDGCHDWYPSGQRVGWNNRNDYTSGGIQDVDYVNPAPEGHIPLENITFPSMKKLKDGKYVFKIHNWNLRQPTNSGFKAEIEFGGQIFQYNHPKPLKHKEWVTLAEVTLKNGVFTIEHKLESQSTSQNKWGIGTEKFHKVKAVCLSPNYWVEKGTGNKHFFFILEGCKTDEKVRAFYNEMIRENLKEDRKVFEMLASRIEVESVENELSGVGFSDTLRSELILEVEGKFRRHIKVKF